MLGNKGFQTAITALKNNYQIAGLYNSKLDKNSQEIKNKNLLKINRKSLVERTLKECLSSKITKLIYVFFDSEDILNLTKKYNTIPIKRPKIFLLICFYIFKLFLKKNKTSIKLNSKNLIYFLSIKLLYSRLNITINTLNFTF